MLVIVVIVVIVVIFATFATFATLVARLRNANSFANSSRKVHTSERQRVERVRVTGFDARGRVAKFNQFRCVLFGFVDTGCGAVRDQCVQCVIAACCV